MTTRQLGIWGAWRFYRRDIALALVVGAIEIIATYFAAHNQTDRRAFDMMGIALLVAGAAGLVFRRQYPVSVLIFAKAATLLYWLLDYPAGPIFLAMIVAFFNVVMRGHRLAAWVILPVGYVSFLWVPYLVGNESAPSAQASLGLAAWLLVLGAAAEALRVRRERSTEAQRTREEEARRRATEERLRIARELHDVLGHNISLINVQAGVALHLIDERPEQARLALAAIKEASKDTLRELRSVLDVLRQAGEEPLRSPSPSLTRLGDLVSQAEAVGLQVRTEIIGNPRQLPASVDMAAFRIAQEALTNVIRHARGATATIRVTHDERELILQIEDNGRGAVSRSQVGAGKGILGMQERAEALGGVIQAGPRLGGGFRVLARLPLDADP